MLDWRQIWGSGRKGCKSGEIPLPCEADCLVKKWLLGAVGRVVTHTNAGCHGHTAGLSWCYGSILGVTMCCRQWHPIPSHQLWSGVSL
ncbi:hypothetical protein TNCV_4665921 [Trichonephila clavipes]|nr:hypothetical protein TNCV_4665921 [Trichonephila clavipes]